MSLKKPQSPQSQSPSLPRRGGSRRPRSYRTDRDVQIAGQVNSSTTLGKDQP
jgi:hypothetical protein